MLSGVKTLKVKLAFFICGRVKTVLSRMRTKNGTRICSESLSLVPFSIEQSLLMITHEHDPDFNFYNDVFTLDTQYLAPDKFEGTFQPFLKHYFSILHLNIRSKNKNFEAFKQFYLSLKFKFSIVCFSETRAHDININKNSTFQLPNCNTEKLQY